MCQLSAYLARSDREELVLQDVELVQVEGGKVFLTNLFQQREAMDARIRTVDLLENKLLLEPSGSEETKQMTEMTEQQKLAIRLDHWIEHNTAHTREFQQGAEQADDLGHRDVRDEILLAAGRLTEASEHLRKALQQLV
jgi:predicted RNA-binding protein